MDDSTHPNLVRLLEQHRRIVSDFGAGLIDSASALEQTSTLRAFDDVGVLWTVGLDGQWYWIGKDGEQHRGEPPVMGFASPLPGDLSKDGRARLDGIEVVAVEIPEVSPEAQVRTYRNNLFAGRALWGVIGLVALILILVLTLP